MWSLVADIGGTNMRIAAVSEGGEILKQHRFLSDGDQGLTEVCAEFIAAQDSTPKHVVVAAAGVVQNDAVTLTNAGQVFSKADLSKACQTSSVHILNDFEGAAWSLATVEAKDVDALQGRLAPTAGPMLIIGPGTGLGVGTLVWHRGQPNVVPGEGGHIRLAPENREEAAYFERLVALWPEVQISDGWAVEAEAILSGTGLPVFYKAIAEVKKRPVTCDTAEGVLSAALQKTDPVAVIAADMFRRFLGALAGDLALTVGALGGVFITGGVAHANQWLFDARFTTAFNAGGRHGQWREQMPVFLYKNPDFGLLGARNFLLSHTEMRASR